ncbi:MAG: flagellar basal-body MS-ring/collar protein FliF [Alphaproteobacteria bacterium]
MAIGDTLKGMGKSKLGAMLAVAMLSIGFFVVITFRFTDANMVPLYTNLSLDDSAKIVAELDKTSTPYELVSGGTQIMVPSDRVLRLRMTMAEQRLPSVGSVVGYEIFDRSESFGSSNFVMNINMVRALEGELSRTIGSISGIESARVHLVMPKRELFTREKDKPSASVTIKMAGGRSIERSEVTAISHLVASAVPGLEAKKVTIVDAHGKLLARGDGDDGMDASASTAQEYRTNYETRMQHMLEDLLEKVIGTGKVRVQVAADMNFDRIVTNSEKYDPDGQVARSTQSTTEREDAKEASGADAVSVKENLPGEGSEGSAGNNSNRATERTDETTNYEISKTVQNHIREGGTVNKLSVAVLVDGTYTEDAEGNKTYAPRPDEELKKLKTLIASAIGFDEKRGDVIELVNMKFSGEMPEIGEESVFERFKLEMQSIIQTLIIAVVAILAIMLVLRPAVIQLSRQGQSPSDYVSGELAALEAPAGMSMGTMSAPAGRLPAAPGIAPAPAAGMPGGPAASQEPELMIDVANIKGGMKSSSVKKINEIVQQYPEETMNVLRQWIIKQA